MRVGLILLLLAIPPLAHSQPLEEVRVTGRRSGQPDWQRPYASQSFDRVDLQGTGSRLDEALGRAPSFSLFRRNGSRTANPTTQGVSLRGIGPNGAGRSLVLVDGVPANDPFGGWVYWSRLPVGDIDRVTLTPGGGAGPWGNAALAGTLRIETGQPGRARAELSAGDLASGSAAFGIASDPRQSITWALSGGATRDQGAPVVRDDQAGAIDRAASLRDRHVSARVRAELGSVVAEARLSGFAEQRGNGTPYTGSRAEAVDAALRLTGGERDGTGWEAVAYASDNDYAATFSSVAAGRSRETPALDQYTVPAQAAGAIGQYGWRWGQGQRTEIGADLRWVEGETRERFLFSGSGFTRERRAGGRQTIVGAFAEHVWQATPALLVSGGARLDRWVNDDGRRRESVLATGAVLRDDRLTRRQGTVTNGRIGFAWQPLATVTGRAAIYTGFRLPTLNELYRPFRVGDDLTEANPALRPERLHGIEVGAEISPASGLTLAATLFRADLRQAVDNRRLTSRTGLFAPLGVFVPAGGSLAQRANLSRVIVRGVEAEAAITLHRRAELTLGYLLSDARIRRDGADGAINGNRLGQAPLHTLTLGLALNPLDRLALRLEARASTGSFESSANDRRLPPALRFDASGDWQATDQISVFIRAENLFDATLESGVRADGLVSVAPSRDVRIGLRAQL